MKPEADALRTRPFDPRNLLRQFQNDFYVRRRSLGGRRRDVWHPPTDVYETARDIVIKVCLAGVRPDQVTIGCNGETISICGWRDGPDPGTVTTYHQMEIRNGYFERRIVLHRAFDPSESRARFQGGFLYIYIPKAERLVRHVLTIELTL